jgi:hypothetical protein
MENFAHGHDHMSAQQSIGVATAVWGRNMLDGDAQPIGHADQCARSAQTIEAGLRSHG